MEPKTFEFCGEIMRETDAAYLIYDGETEVWIPKSQIKEQRQVNGGTVFIIPEWLAVKKGIV